MFESHNAHLSTSQFSVPISSVLSAGPSRLTAEDETKSDKITLVATFSNSADLTSAVHDISTRPVGCGDLSDVYTGIWRSVHGDQKVAIKVIRARPSTSDTDTLSSILLRELSRWQRLQHRNVDVLFGFFDGYGPVPALVSPWYESGNVISYLQRRAGNPDVKAIKIELLLGAMTGLCYLHDQSIVHGGIRGNNVLVNEEGIARLCDVGLTPILSQNSQSFEHSGGIEPDRYRCSAPELSLVEGARHSYASDVWASGCLFIEVWSATEPHPVDQLFLALRKDEQPTRLSEISFPDFLWQLILECCKAVPSQRPSAADIVTQIQVHSRTQPLSGL